MGQELECYSALRFVTGDKLLREISDLILLLIDLNKSLSDALRALSLWHCRSPRFVSSGTLCQLSVAGQQGYSCTGEKTIYGCREAFSRRASGWKARFISPR